MLASASTLIISFAAVLALVILLARHEDAAARCWRENMRSGSRCRCGYDLRATPDRCPECGREVMQDE